MCYCYTNAVKHMLQQQILQCESKKSPLRFSDWNKLNSYVANKDYRIAGAAIQNITF